MKLYQVTTFHIGFKIEIITKDQSHTRHTTILLMSAWQIGQPIPIATTVSTQVVQKRAWPHGIWNKCYSISQPDEAHLTVACRYWRRWPETLCCRQWHGTVPYCCITQVANISLWTTVMQFHVVHFHVLQFGPSFLRLVFSAPPPSGKHPLILHQSFTVCVSCWSAFWLSSTEIACISGCFPDGGGAENTRRKNDGPNCNTCKCTTWNCMTVVHKDSSYTNSQLSCNAAHIGLCWVISSMPDCNAAHIGLCWVISSMPDCIAAHIGLCWVISSMPDCIAAHIGLCSVISSTPDCQSVTPFQSRKTFQCFHYLTNSDSNLENGRPPSIPQNIYNKNFCFEHDRMYRECQNLRLLAYQISNSSANPLH